MDRAGFEDWLRRYFDAWVSNDPVDVGALFTEDAIYWVGPFREPWVGRDQIVDRWTSGHQEDVRAAFDVIAFDGDTGVAHWNVTARTGDKRPDGMGRDTDDHVRPRRPMPGASRVVLPARDLLTAERTIVRVRGGRVP